jgi:predicted DCC family thiol-disulfide oxidoreductase YuxK
MRGFTPPLPCLIIPPMTTARSSRDAYSYRNDPAVRPFPDDRPIILFDGICALCTGWAKFVLKHDRKARFRLLTAQSALGHELYVHYGLDPTNYETNILIEDGIAWFRSEGSIRMFKGLGLPWSLVRIVKVLPLGVRDTLYNWVAKRRLKLFGQLEQCYLPPPDYRDRLIA